MEIHPIKKEEEEEELQNLPRFTNLEIGLYGM